MGRQRGDRIMTQDYYKTLHYYTKSGKNAQCMNGSAHLRMTADLGIVTCKECLKQIKKRGVI